MGYPLPQVLQRRSEETRAVNTELGQGSCGRIVSLGNWRLDPRRTAIWPCAVDRPAVSSLPTLLPQPLSLLYSTGRSGFLYPFMALWCNWLTRRPLKAKSPGSSPGNATKNPNKINSLKRNKGCRSFAFFGLVALWSHFCSGCARYESSGTDSVPPGRQAPPENST